MTRLAQLTVEGACLIRDVHPLAGEAATEHPKSRCYASRMTFPWVLGVRYLGSDSYVGFLRENEFFKGGSGGTVVLVLGFSHERPRTKSDPAHSPSPLNSFRAEG